MVSFWLPWFSPGSVLEAFGPITMDGVKAAGVHRLVELGLKDQAKDPAWVTVLEAEKVDPLPPLSDLVVIQAVFLNRLSEQGVESEGPWSVQPWFSAWCSGLHPRTCVRRLQWLGRV